ncbi:MAG: HPF/RaiA family ribosome-associated protein [Candidatus Rokubacteria bacterium]|nr:HPF/RaiA family ribosome-associated protein [Candidatus Rokubacteria bacterium]
MKIELRGVSLAPRLGARIEKRLGRELGRIHTSPVTALVTFADDNGPKGGRATRCALTVRVPRRPTIRVEDVAETAWLAFDRSFAGLRRRLAAYREWRLERTRYPKKYFAAKRLLTAGLAAKEEAEKP